MESATQNLINIKKIVYRYCKLNNISPQKTKNIYYLTIAYCYNDRCFFNLLKNTSVAISHYEQKTNIKLLIQLFNAYYIQNNPMDIFIEFLNGYGVFDSFKKELIIQKEKDINAMFCQISIERWIIGPFSWMRTTQGFDFWDDLHKKWSSFVVENKYNFFNITNDSYDNYDDYKCEIKNIMKNNKYIDKWVFRYLK